jgi:hypothetical protein
MTEQAEGRTPTQVKTVPMTPELSAELYRLCGRLALAKQRSAAWLKHGLSGALSPAGFFARWLRYDETEVALTEEIRRLSYPPVQLALKKSDQADIAA